MNTPESNKVVAKPPQLRLEPMAMPKNRPTLPADFLAEQQKFENHQRIANALADVATHCQRQHGEIAGRLTPDQQAYMADEGTKALAALGAIKALVNSLVPGSIP